MKQSIGVKTDMPDKEEKSAEKLHEHVQRKKMGCGQLGQVGNRGSRWEGENSGMLLYCLVRHWGLLNHIALLWKSFLQGPDKLSCPFPDWEMQRFVTYYLCNLLCSLKGGVACSRYAWTSCCIVLWYSGSVYCMMRLYFQFFLRESLNSTKYNHIMLKAHFKKITSLTIHKRSYSNTLRSLFHKG